MSRYKIVLFLSFLLSHGLYAKYLNFGRADANKTIQEYKNFNETFNSAYIGIPKGVRGLLNHLWNIVVKHYRRYQI